jgi:hypothetical protein
LNVHIRINTNQLALVFGLSPFESYDDVLVDARNQSVFDRHDAKDVDDEEPLV